MLTDVTLARQGTIQTQGRLDWMFLWCCLLRYSYLRLEKICLKAALKAVPGFGGYTAGALPLCM